MSRGGRGGGWGGGGGGPNAAGKMGGQALPWEHDPELEANLSSVPSERFPPIQPPIAEPPTHEERRMVHHFRTLRARIHDGPFYTILDSTARVNKMGQRSPPAAHYNPFDSAPTYSQRYVRKRNTLPRLSTRPFVKEFFPKELWLTLDPTSANPSSSSAPKKSLTLFTKTKADRVAAALASMGANDDPDNADAAGGADDDNADDPDNEDATAGAGKDGEDGADDEDPDQFDEEDEDDMDDYNAEQYFDGGDDDDYGGDEGGGGEDDY